MHAAVRVREPRMGRLHYWNYPFTFRMTTTSKVLIGVVVLAAVALVAVFAVRPHAASSPTGEAALPTSASDTSDDALAKDSAAIDAQLQGLDDDSATVDQGISEASQ